MRYQLGTTRWSIGCGTGGEQNGITNNRLTNNQGFPPMLSAQKTIVPAVAAIVLAIALLLMAIMTNTAMFLDSANGIWYI